MAQRADSEFGNPVEVVETVAVPSLQALVTVIVANTRDGTFDTAPKL
jgi:hypothetical protein